MKKFLNIALSVAVLATSTLILSSCGSSKKTVKNNDEEVEVKLYCSGPEFRTRDGVMRANASGVSEDQELAREKALTNARNRLSEQLEVMVSNLTDYYKKETDLGQNSNMEKRFEDLIREVSKNKLQGTYPVCEKVTRTKEGKYKAYVAVELGGEEFMKQSANRLSKDDELKVDYDYEKFKGSYEQAMEKLEDERGY